MRTIQLDLTATDYADLCSNILKCQIEAHSRAVQAQDRDALRRAEAINAHHEVHKAIGYLSTWAIPSDDSADTTSPYSHVRITCADTGARGEPELVACFYFSADNAPGAVNPQRPTYVIGAIWHDDHWGFHS